MKELLFVILVSSFLFITCDSSIFDGNTTIQNKSTYTIDFKFQSGNTRQLTIAPGKTETFYSHGANMVRFSSFNYRVSYKKLGDYKGEFYNTIPLPMNIRNVTSVTVTITEKNNAMDVDNIIINSDEILEIGNIYTTYPNFSTIPTANISYVVTNNILYVTIH